MKIRQISVACPGLFDRMALPFKKIVIKGTVRI